MRRRAPGLRGRARARRLAFAVLATTLGSVAVARDAHAVDDERGRPWGRRTTLVSPGFGLGLGNYATQLEFSLGGRYFVLDGLAVGLTLSDSVLIFKESIKSTYPGINKLIPTNIFRIVPSLQYVFFRSRWFSPYVHAGVGPAFSNNGRGTFGHWVAGPGAYIGIGGPVFLDIGVDFSGMFPIGKCNRAFTASVRGSSGITDVEFSGMCAFGWSPKIGIVVALGRKSKRRAPPSPPPGNPLPETFEPLPPPEPSEPPPPLEAPVEAPSDVPTEPPIATPPPSGESPTETAPVEPTPSSPPPPGEAPSPTQVQPPVAVPD